MSLGAFARSDRCGGSLKDSAAKAEAETREGEAEGEAEEAGGCRPETLLGGWSSRTFRQLIEHYGKNREVDPDYVAFSCVFATSRGVQ